MEAMIRDNECGKHGTGWYWSVAAVILFMIGNCGGQNATVPPVVEKQFRAMARMQNLLAPGLHLSSDNQNFIYNSHTSTASKSPAREGGYQITLGRNLNGGIEVSADGIEFPLKFQPVNNGVLSPKGVKIQNHLVYRASGIRYEYEFKKNGLKEEIILDSAPSSDLNLAFEFQQDENLEFQLDSKGNLLVYGADPVLSGFIQTGDERSAELLMKARRHAKKDHLLFLIPAPVITDANVRKYKHLAHYSYAKKILTLHTGDLSHLVPPITIDSSIVVTSSADFLTGNNEGMISYDTDAVSRDVPSGMWLGSWSATTNFSTARSRHTSVAYNGYLYIIGGEYDNGSSILNDVQFALINSDGMIGSWTTTTSFATGRYGHSSVVYNGFLYVLGGYNGSIYMNDVQFAPINSDGTVGAWSFTTSFATARRYHTSVVYNGYIYIIGGTNGANLNDVQFASVNGNGTVGNWNAATSFAAGRIHHSSIAYHGYLYVIGGYDGSDYLNDVQVASINSNGTLGFWTASTSFPIARSEHTSVAFNGYLYIIGGMSTGSCLNDVQAAPINSSGSVGSWKSTSNFTTMRCGHSSAVIRNYIYVMGGHSASGYLNDVQVAPINSRGTIGSWSVTTPLSGARFGHASVSYNGYLYVLGGNDSSGFLNDVQYAAINSDGTIGVWHATTSFPVARRYHSSIAYNGYLYVIGGDMGFYPLCDVQYAPILPNGTVGIWNSTTNFITPRRDLASIAYNGFLYVIGGYGMALLNDVQYAPIHPDGTVGSWNQTSPFAGIRLGHKAVVYNGYLYVIGGYNGYLLNDVQFALIRSDGTVGSWTAAASFPTPRCYHAAVASNGYLYIIGGDESYAPTLPLNDIQVAPINADGTIGPWSATTNFLNARHSHASVINNGYLYVIGGNDGTNYLDDVQVALISSTGTVSPWSATSNFTTARYGHTSVAYNGYLYVIGGSTDPVFLNDVQYAPIHADGTIGAWTATTSFVEPRQGHTSLAYNSYLYILGGYTGAYLNDVQFAPINSDGSVGTWSSTTSFSIGRSSHNSVVNNGYLYVMGGYPNGDDLNDVQFAPINSNGTLGSWNATTSFITGRHSFASVAYNGNLYVIEGFDSSGAPLNDAQFAPINSDGTVGTWNAASGLNMTRGSHASVVYNGYIYVLGGFSRKNYHNDVQFAPINSDGTLGAWDTTVSFSTSRAFHTSVTYNGYLYLIGGETSNGLVNDVQYSTLIGPAPHSTYSKLLDAGPGNWFMESLSFHSSSGGNQNYMITYAVAPDATAAFGVRTTVLNAVSGSTYTSGLGCGRYVWVKFDLDDLNNITNDSGGTINRKDLLDFTLSFDPLSSAGNTIAATKTSVVHLTWTPVPGATSYIVQRCDATAIPCTPYTIAATSNLFFDDPVLPDTSSYWYLVLPSC